MFLYYFMSHYSLMYGGCRIVLYKSVLYHTGRSVFV